MVLAITEPGSLSGLATALQIDPLAFTERFVDAVRDYGAEVARDTRKFWAGWDQIGPKQARDRKRQKRAQTLARVRKFRAKNRGTHERTKA
jgi:hypothetical protein